MATVTQRSIPTVQRVRRVCVEHAAIFCAVAPPLGWRHLEERERKARSGLAGRIPDRPTLARELRAWQRVRNQTAPGIRWQFTAADARVKLLKLYPSTHE